MSASMRPTFAPAIASDTARLVVTVDFPTPPFPEATAMIFFTPGSNGALSRNVVTDDVMLMLILIVSPATVLMAASHSLRIMSLRGQAGVVSTTVNETLLSDTTTSLIMLRLTRSRLISGSLTVERAFRTWSLVIFIRRENAAN